MVLLICLVVLVLLGLLGISAAQTGTLQTRLIANEFGALLTFQAAEASLREAEARLRVLEHADWCSDDASALGWIVKPTAGAIPWRERDGWMLTTAPTVSGDLRSGAISARYLIEHLTTLPLDESAVESDPSPTEDSVGCAKIFRITAWAVLAPGGAETRLQTTFRVDLTDLADLADLADLTDRALAGGSGRLSWRELEFGE